MYIKRKIFFSLFFLFFNCFSNFDEKVHIQFDKLFPENLLENFYKTISLKMEFLKNSDLQKVNKEDFLDNSLNYLLDMHAHIFLIKNYINDNNFIFKEDLQNLLLFVQKINNFFKTLLIENNLKIKTINLLLDNAIDKLKQLIK